MVHYVAPSKELYCQNLHAQTVLTVEDIEALKQKTGEGAVRTLLQKRYSITLNANIQKLMICGPGNLKKAVKRKMDQKSD